MKKIVSLSVLSIIIVTISSCGAQYQRSNTDAVDSLAEMGEIIDSIAGDYIEYIEPDTVYASESSYDDDNDNHPQIVSVTTTETPNVYGTISSSTVSTDNNDYYNYIETSDCVEGIVVYEGTDDYFIIETKLGFSIAERYKGHLYEGNKVRGELNRYGNKYIINRGTDSETRINVDEYMLTDEGAINWMGKHNHLKTKDQETYDYNNN